MDIQTANNLQESDNLHLLNDKNRQKSCLEKVPKRHILAIFAFFGFFFAYILRANLSVAIVQMSRKNIELSTDNTTNLIDKNVRELYPSIPVKLFFTCNYI